LVFEKLPNNTFGLIEWYPNKKKKNRSEEIIEKVEKLSKGSNAEEVENISEIITDNIVQSVTQEEPISRVTIRRKRTKPAAQAGNSSNEEENKL
jgi:uncharacterized membrane protein